MPPIPAPAASDPDDAGARCVSDDARAPGLFDDAGASRIFDDARASGLFGDNLRGVVLDGLARRGWAHLPAVLDPELIAALRDEALALADGDGMAAAGVGRGRDYLRSTAVRGTRIKWLDGSSAAQARLLAGCAALRHAFNRQLFLGLGEFEAHFALYPPGGHYVRHLDAFARPANPAGPAPLAGFYAPRSRVVSMVLYLNAAWDPADGGSLALWEDVPRDDSGRPDLAALDDVAPAAVIQPDGGSLLFMLSEEIPHEVRETSNRRLAIAGWWRLNAAPCASPASA